MDELYTKEEVFTILHGFFYYIYTTLKLNPKERISLITRIREEIKRNLEELRQYPDQELKTSKTLLEFLDWYILHRIG